MKFLFAGDSVTDMMKRSEYSDDFPYSLGMGYVFFASELLYQDDVNNVVINRGIGGNRITDLEERFQDDVLNINADVVTILIGVNDVWHHFSHGAKLISVTKWTEIYQGFIDKLKRNNKHVRIILMEPSYLPGNAFVDGYYDDFAILKRYQKKTKQLAKNNNIEFVPLQKKMTKYGEKIGNNNVLYDGVHPNVLGSKLIAKEWFKQYKKMR